MGKDVEYLAEAQHHLRLATEAAIKALIAAEGYLEVELGALRDVPVLRVGNPGPGQATIGFQATTPDGERLAGVVYVPQRLLDSLFRLGLWIG